MSSLQTPGVRYKVKVGVLAPVVFEEAGGLALDVAHPERIVLKRGVVPIGGVHGWFTEHLDKIAWSRNRPMAVSIEAVDAKGQVQQSWSWVKGYPVKWGVCQQNVDGQNMSVDQVELVCEAKPVA